MNGVSLDEQFRVLGSLSEKVHMVYLDLRIRETDYLMAMEAHSDAKKVLARAIDDAYDAGDVVGKNEREREAHLRKLMPSLYNDEARLEALMRGAERLFKVNLRDAERLALQVQIAQMVYNFGASKIITDFKVYTGDE